MNHALEPVLDVLRMRLEPSARMTPEHAKSHTTSVDLLMQRVVGLSPSARMTDDLIGDCARNCCMSLSSVVFAAVCNIAVGGKEVLQNLLRNLYAPLPIVGNAYGTPHPLSFVETLLATDPQDYPQFVEMVPLPPAPRHCCPFIYVAGRSSMKLCGCTLCAARPSFPCVKSALATLLNRFYGSRP